MLACRSEWSPRRHFMVVLVVCEISGKIYRMSFACPVPLHNMKTTNSVHNMPTVRFSTRHLV